VKDRDRHLNRESNSVIMLDVSSTLNKASLELLVRSGLEGDATGNETTVLGQESAKDEGADRGELDQDVDGGA